MPIYCFSTDEEMFHDHCEAADIDAARKISEEELCLEDGQAYYVGLRKDVHPEMKLSANSILEGISDLIWDEVGEISEDWPNANAIQVKELERRLQAVMFAWMEEYKLQPTFYQVVDTQTFVAGD